MDRWFEITAIAAVLAGTWWWIRPRGLMAFLSGVLAVGLLGMVWNRPPVDRPDAPPIHRDADYVSSNTCRECHPGEYATWYASFHRKMTQIPSAETMLAEFPVTLSDRGRTFEMKQEGDAFYARMVEGDSEFKRIVMTTGSHHMQSYWMEFDGWFLQLPWMWLVKEETWIPTVDSFLRPPHEDEPPGIWNRSCLHCHTTGGDPGSMDMNVDPGTRVAEFGIACEACHRGGGQHVAAMKNPFRRYSRRLDDTPDEAVFNPHLGDNKEQVAVCGRCHSVHVPFEEKVDLTTRLRPGEQLAKDRVVVRVAANPIPRQDRMLEPLVGNSPKIRVTVEGKTMEVPLQGISGLALYLAEPALADARSALAEITDPKDGRRFTVPGSLRGYPGGAELTLTAPPADLPETLANVLGYGTNTPTLFDLDSFWHDGAVRTVGREYNGITRTACYTRGTISCMDCHSMHKYTGKADMLKPRMDTDQACADCHPDKMEDISAHTHHPADSEGSRCMNCHMPNTTYGLLGATRSHDIDLPEPHMSAHTGRPNACSLCHLDKPLAWAHEKKKAWYGAPDFEFDEVEETVAAGLMWLTRGNAAQRAVVAWNAGWPPALEASGEEWLRPILADLLHDDYMAVRAIAEKSLGPDMVGDDYVFWHVKPDPIRDQLIEDWAKEAHPRAERALGLKAPGVRDEALLRELRSQRDNRPVRISE